MKLKRLTHSSNHSTLILPLKLHLDIIKSVVYASTIYNALQAVLGINGILWGGGG